MEGQTDETFVLRRLQRLIAAIGLALVASVSAPAAMAWAAPYPAENDDGPVLENTLPEDETPEHQTFDLSELDPVVVLTDSTQFDLIFIALCLQVLLLAGVLVSIWALR